MSCWLPSLSPPALRCLPSGKRWLRSPIETDYSSGLWSRSTSTITCTGPSPAGPPANLHWPSLLPQSGPNLINQTSVTVQLAFSPGREGDRRRFTFVLLCNSLPIYLSFLLSLALFLSRPLFAQGQSAYFNISIGRVVFCRRVWTGRRVRVFNGPLPPPTGAPCVAPTRRTVQTRSGHAERQILKCALRTGWPPCQGRTGPSCM